MSNQNKLRKLENRKIELIRNIQLCEYNKKKLIRFVQELNSQYNQKLISYEKYYDELNNVLKQKTPEQWIKYYDKCIEYYEYHLDVCEKEIKKEKRKREIIPIIATLAILIILGFGLFFLKPTITGFVIQESTISFDRILDCEGCEQHKVPPSIDVNMTIIANFIGITQNDTLADYFEKEWMVVNLNDGVVEEYDEIYNKISWIVNGDNGTVSRNYVVRGPALTVPPTDYYFQSELANVKSELWDIKVEVPINITIPEIPPEIPVNITVPEIPINIIELIQEQAEINKPVKWKAKIKAKDESEARSKLPSLANIISSQEIEIETFEINYETPAPQITEEQISETRKRVIVTGPDLNYTNILTFTTIPEKVKLGNENKIKVYWIENNSYIKFNASDTDNNNLIDHIEWIVPYLSNQTFEISITILNVQSYPQVGDIWEVAFNTTGTADLKIYASNGTIWTDYSESGYDLKFLEIKCGNEILSYQFIKETETCETGTCYVYISNYSCEETGYETSKVLTPGRHTLHFIFGEEEAYAHNQANVIVAASLVEIGSTDVAATTCTASNVNSDDTLYCGDTLSIDGGEQGYVNSTHSYNVPSTATIDNVTICTRFFLTSKLDDNAADTTKIYVAENSTGSWIYTQKDSCLGTGCTTWETESTHCYDVTTIINTPTKASNVLISVFVYQSDADNNQFQSVDYNYVNLTYTAPDATAPIISLIAPANNSINATTNDIILQFNSTEAGNCSLYWDLSTTPSNSIQITANTTQNFSKVDVAVGDFWWNVTCGDLTGDNNNSKIFNFSITFEENAPIVSLIAPENNSINTTTDDITFQFNSTESGSCSIYIDSVLNNSQTVTANTTSEFTINNFPNNNDYWWNITCADLTGDNNASKIFNFSVAIGNAAPVVDFVSAIPSQSITEASATSISFIFNATDQDGASNLDDTTATGRFNKSGETTRSNLSCVQIQESGNTRSYNCTVKVWYWDGAGNWTINASIRDLSNVYAENITTEFELGQTAAMKMSPTSLNWGTLYPGNTNNLSTSDPIVVNNTGNKDITSGNVRVNAINLRGEQQSSYIIPATNFTVNVIDACEGTAMVNGTAIGITNSILTAGNLSASEAQEELYFCLEQVPINITSQSYSTLTSQEWIVDIQ